MATVAKKLTEIVQLESWLSILICTYKEHPSIGLAKTISYYLERVINHDDFDLKQHHCCHYRSMKKYWRWQCTK